jgi:hypothetical protein
MSNVQVKDDVSMYVAKAQLVAEYYAQRPRSKLVLMESAIYAPISFSQCMKEVLIRAIIQYLIILAS